MSLFSSSSKRKPGMPFILSLVFIDMFCLGIIIPVLPLLIGTHTTDPQLQAFWYGALVVSYGMMEFFLGPLLGALSDRFGRRPILVLSMFGLAASNFMIGTVESLWMLLFARIIAGVTQSCDAVSNAYAADITPPKDRAKVFGQFGIAFGMGFILGPLVGGWLANISIHMPFYVVGVLALINGLYGLFMLPESLPQEKRSKFSIRRANPLSAFMVLVRRRDIGVLIIVWVLFQLAFAMMIESWVLYTNFRYGWDANMNGIALGCVGIATAVAQGFLMKVLVDRFGEERTVLIGLFTGAVGFTLYGLVPQGWMMFPIILLTIPLYATGPALLAIVSKATKPTEQGLTIGSLMSVRTLMVVIGPAFATGVLGIMAQQVGDLPHSDVRLGVVFFICALLSVVCLLFVYLHLSQLRKASKNVA
ncbi:MFS transporter [Bacillus mojavensis]|uniref:MFS transporter n=1 Tax=Bacillus mojavensis TaxID=72360 RepID=UPI002DB73200|nr:MFS transporter [Bacillus mojavensis]MEC1614770.1 MFS transporter [Bacillus mojavensis]MEC1690664.1 MFS transporter [Bacillus mojavensis]